MNVWGRICKVEEAVRAESPMDAQHVPRWIELKTLQNFCDTIACSWKRGSCVFFRSPWFLKGIAFNKHLLHVNYSFIYFFFQHIFYESLIYIRYIGKQNSQSQPTEDTCWGGRHSLCLLEAYHPVFKTQYH